MTYTEGLILLSDAVIKNASPIRGEVDPRFPERRDERPYHIPEFMQEVVNTRALLRNKALNDEQCKSELESLLGQILREASRRKPQIPAYFETALYFCGRFQPVQFYDWYVQEQFQSGAWNRVLVAKIESIVALPPPHQ